LNNLYHKKLGLFFTKVFNKLIDSQTIKYYENALKTSAYLFLLHRNLKVLGQVEKASKM